MQVKIDSVEIGIAYSKVEPIAIENFNKVLGFQVIPLHKPFYGMENFRDKVLVNLIDFVYL